jgi:hypothetical protein
MNLALPTPQEASNQITLANSLLDQILSDPKYSEHTEELSIIRNYRSGNGKINLTIRAVESLSKKTTS